MHPKTSLFSLSTAKLLLELLIFYFSKNLLPVRKRCLMAANLFSVPIAKRQPELLNGFFIFFEKSSAYLI